MELSAYSLAWKSMSGFRMTPRKQLPACEDRNSAGRAHYEEDSKMAEDLQWREVHFAAPERNKTSKGQEVPEEPPQGKTSIWSFSAHKTQENQVSSCCMKWEQAWTSCPSCPALCAEGWLKQVSMVELQKRNHFWDQRIRWKDCILQGNTKIGWLNNGIGYSALMNRCLNFLDPRDASSYTKDLENITTSTVCSLLLNIGEACDCLGLYIRTVECTPEYFTQYSSKSASVISRKHV